MIHGLGSLLQPTHYLLLELQQRLIPLYQASTLSTIMIMDAVVIMDMAMIVKLIFDAESYGG